MEALVVIDVQNAMFEEGVFNGGKLLQNINHLLTKARAANTPVFYVQHNETPGGGPWNMEQKDGKSILIFLHK